MRAHLRISAAVVLALLFAIATGASAAFNAPTLTLVASPNPASWGDTVTLTATLDTQGDPTAPTGTPNFFIVGNLHAGSAWAPAGGSTYTSTVQFAADGTTFAGGPPITVTLSVTYSDAHYTPQVLGQASFTVNPLTATVTMGGTSPVTYFDNGVQIAQMNVTTSIVDSNSNPLPNTGNPSVRLYYTIAATKPASPPSSFGISPQQAQGAFFVALESFTGTSGQWHYVNTSFGPLPAGQYYWLWAIFDGTATVAKNFATDYFQLQVLPWPTSVVLSGNPPTASVGGHATLTATITSTPPINGGYPGGCRVHFFENNVEMPGSPQTMTGNNTVTYFPQLTFTAGTHDYYAVWDPTTCAPGPWAAATSNTTETVVGGTPTLSIVKAHVGANFTQGQNGAQYTLTVNNTGTAATTGTITVADTLPAGLTFVGGSGTGWSCGAVAQVVTCTDAATPIAQGGSSVITLTVNVAANAAASLQNSATVNCACTGLTTPSNTDIVSVTPLLPDLTIAKAHVGTGFTQGQNGAQYTLTVTNGGAGATTGTITVTDTLPAGLSFVSGAGTGWSCGAVAQLVTCTDAATPIAGGGHSAITLTVNVAANAAATLQNAATVACTCAESSTGNNTSNTDVVNVAPVQPDLTITKTHAGDFTQGQTGATYTITVANNGNAPTDGTTITVTDLLPAGLVATGIGGTGWTCAQPAGPCTRSDVLNAGQSYPALAMTVNVAAGASSLLVNTATVTGGGDAGGANATANDLTAVIPIGGVAATAIPALGEYALLLLAFALAALGLRGAARRPSG